MADAISEARDRWLAATPAERADMGPAALATFARALATLTERLAALDYPVARFTAACPSLGPALATFEDSGIEVPPALSLLWRDVGAICLVDLDRYRHVAFWEAMGHRSRLPGGGGAARGSPPHCDGLVIDGPTEEGWVDDVIDSSYAVVEDGGPPAIEIAPDDLHKDNVSGAGPYEIVLPRPGEDPWLAVLDGGFRWGAPRPASAPRGQPDLVSYLRTAVLECGGFPGLYGHEAFESTLRGLAAGLPVF